MKTIGSETEIIAIETGSEGVARIAPSKWRALFAPELIFAISAAAALSPYLLWYFGFEAPILQRLELTYLPVVIWAVGLLSFIIGARIAKRTKRVGVVFKLAESNLPLTFFLCAGLGLVLVQVYFAVRDVYGVVPLLDYMSTNGRMDVGVANDEQQYSGFGQLGLVTATLYVLNPLLLLVILQWMTRRRGSRLLILAGLAVVAFAHLLNAKRQGIYSTLFYLVACTSIYSGNPVRAVSAFLGARSRFLARTCLAVLASVLVVAFGYIASIRTRGRVDANMDEIVAYLQYPLVNFEKQCMVAGLGPGEFKPFGPLRNLAPYKYTELADAFTLTTPRLMLSSPSGMYEYIHWCWGIGGVIGYSIMLGFVSRWLYDRALESLPCLVSYGFVAVALAMAHSNNQVLILSYVPVPLCFVSFLNLFVSTESFRRSDIPPAAFATGCSSTHRV